MPLLEYVQAPTIVPLREYSSLPESFITRDTKIKLETATFDCRLFFTTDGSEPDVYSNTGRTGTFRYRKPFSLNIGQRTIRAVAISRKGAHQSAIVTKTFLVREHIRDYVTSKPVEDQFMADNDTLVSQPIDTDLTLEALKRRELSLRYAHQMDNHCHKYDREKDIEEDRNLQRRIEEENGYADESSIDDFFRHTAGNGYGKWENHRHRSRSRSPASGYRHDVDEEALEALEIGSPIPPTVHFQEDENFDVDEEDSDLDTEVLLNGFSNGQSRMHPRPSSPVSDVMSSRSRDRMHGDIVIDPDLPVFIRRNRNGLTSIDNYIDDNLEEELEEITESDIMTSRSEEKRRRSRSRSRSPKYNRDSERLEERRKEQRRGHSSPSRQSRSNKSTKYSRESNRIEQRKKEQRREGREVESEEAEEEEEDEEEEYRQEALPPQPKSKRFVNKSNKELKNKKVQQRKEVKQNVKHSVPSSLLSSSGLSSSRSSELSSTRSSELSTARTSEISSARSSSSFSSISSLASISSAADLAEKERTDELAKKVKVKRREEDRRENANKAAQGQSMKLLASITEDLENRKPNSSTKGKKTGTVRNRISSGNDEEETKPKEVNLKAKEQRMSLSKSKVPSKSTKNQAAVLPEPDGQLNFINDSGTQINFWNTAPEDLLQGVKNRVNQAVSNGLGSHSEPVHPQASGSLINSFHKDHQRPSHKKTIQKMGLSVDDFLSSDESESVEETDDASEVIIQAAQEVQAYSSNFPGEAVNQETQMEQKSVGSFFKKLFGIQGKDPENATAVGRLGNTGGKHKKYSDIVAKCKQSKKLWEDKDFPTDSKSLYLSRKSKKEIEWKRPHEICSNPKFIVGGASRFDIKQGVLGNCWLLAAVASLTTDENLLHRVVPKDQSFSQKYYGVFRFRFWQYGSWVEVCIDDRLPTKNGQLMYMHSVSKDEFWSPLLEKAYAKLAGCYENLSGGLQSEAMEDFTGGVVEKYDFHTNLPSNMFQIMLKACERRSLLGCSIDAQEGHTEDQLDNGLIIGHAYSVTNVTIVDTKRGHVELVRVRNPWGNDAEWTGAWSDQSKEWTSLSDRDKQRLGLTFEHDGEFWMSFKDFSANFQRLEICNLMPDISKAESSLAWNYSLHIGSWKSKVNAGGCRNYKGTYWTNPEFRIKVTDPDDDDDEDLCTVIVGLMQCGRRRLRSQGKANLTIGYDIYQCDGTRGTLDKKFFNCHSPTESSPQYINMREVCGRHRLTPGEYVVVPTTFEPNQEADFIIRVFTEKESDVREVDEPTSMISSEAVSAVHCAPVNSAQEMDIAEAAQEEFEAKAGDDQELDAYELRDILNNNFSKGFDCGEFPLELCRSLVALWDHDQTGMLGLDEFKELWIELKDWQNKYKEFDADNNGHFNSCELRIALKSLGYQTSNDTFSAIVKRYSNKKGHIDLHDFIACIIKVKSMFRIFHSKMKGQQASFNLDEFAKMTLYS